MYDRLLKLSLPAINTAPASFNFEAAVTELSGWTVEVSTIIFSTRLPDVRISATTDSSTASLLI
jgi:hypothetical protein